MSPATLIVAVVLALDGEAVDANNTGLAVISLVSIVLGYLLIAGLWYFVFREKARTKRRNGRGS